MRTSLWQHQKDALAFAQGKPGVMLAHDMGAGKTLTAIALLISEGYRRILIICPKKAVAGVWPHQIERHVGDAIEAVPLVKGTVEARTKKADQAYARASHHPVAIIINYEAAKADAFKVWSLKREWDCVILDESHRIKAPGGVTSMFMAVLGRRARRRLCLTGTPLAHGPLDIYGQYRFLDPSIFGTSYRLFEAEYAIINTNFHNQVLGYRNLGTLHEKFYSIAHRVETRDVLDLPEERDDVIAVDLGPRAIAHYEELEEDFYTRVEEGEVTAANALTLLLRLQQLTGGYLKSDEGEITRVDTGKRDALDDFLEDLPNEEKLVVFGRFIKDLDTVKEVAEKHGRVAGEISGRHDDYQRWIDGEINVIAIQLQAGGEGLNELVTSRYCVYYSVGFSLAQYRQSRARLVRPGQHRNVVFYHLIAQNTIDERVYKALANREEVVESILKGRV